MLGSTDRYGNITIQRGLSGRVLDETLRHEVVHSVLTPRWQPLNNATTWLYQKSGLYRFVEEAAAETYATRSLSQGLRFPVRQNYVTLTRMGVELGGVTAVGGGAAYGLQEVWS